jgi:nucleoside-diphosphate-sugar epimerase
MSKSIEKNILLFGATGKTGIQLCEELKRRNIPTSAFVREESSDKLKSDGLRIKIGDVLNLKDVEAAFQNEAYTDVIIALGSKALKKSIIRSKGTEHIIQAMGVNPKKSKIHLISALGVGDSWNQLKWHAKLLSNMLLKSVMNDHQKQEELVTNSPYPYHIIRPVGLKDGESLGDYHVQTEGFLPDNTILRADLAKYLVQSMVENKSGFSAISQ